MFAWLYGYIVFICSTLKLDHYGYQQQRRCRLLLHHQNCTLSKGWIDCMMESFYHPPCHTCPSCISPISNRGGRGRGCVSGGVSLCIRGCGWVHYWVRKDTLVSVSGEY